MRFDKNFVRNNEANIRLFIVGHLVMSKNAHYEKRSYDFIQFRLILCLIMHSLLGYDEFDRPLKEAIKWYATILKQRGWRDSRYLLSVPKYSSATAAKLAYDPRYISMPGFESLLSSLEGYVFESKKEINSLRTRDIRRLTVQEITRTHSTLTTDDTLTEQKDAKKPKKKAKKKHVNKYHMKKGR